MRTATGAKQARQGSVRGVLRSAAFAIFLSLATLCGTFLTPASAQSYTFSSIEIEGNTRVDAATILNYAGIARGTPISAGDLNDAFQRISVAGLFEKVELVPQGGKLLIRVVEYPTINVISFEGNRRLKDEVLTGLIKSQARRFYSPSQAEADAAVIAEAYRQAGRIAATVDPRIIRRSDNRVDLVFEVREGNVSEVERLAFIGNRAYSERRLRQVLETKQAGLLRSLIKNDSFIAERIDLDKQLLRDFYLSRGYVDVQVLDASSQFSRDRNAFFVNFTIREGQQFKFGKISTVSEVDGIDAAEFDALLRIRPGVVYSPSIVENNITRMENLALRKGLNFVRFEPRMTRNDRDQSIDIQFVISRGPKLFVERIDIEGNTTTLDQVIRRQFRSVEGDPFNPREVRQSAERIRALGFFKVANVDSQQGSAADQVVVKVDVEEQPTGSLSFGISYGVTAGPGLALALSESNFLGRGQAVGVNIGFGIDNVDSSISFTEPAFLGRDLKLKFNVYYRTTDQQDARYNTESIGFSPALEFPISELGRLEFRYRISEDRVLDVSAGSSNILLREEDRGSEFTSSIGYSYSYDSRTSGINPLGGVLLRFGQDYAGLGGALNYVSTNVFALAERKIRNEEVTLRAIFEGGYVNTFGGDTRVTERFFANGKLRGFERNGIGPRDLTSTNRDALGGNAFAVARFEADFPLGLPEEYGVTGGLFLDVGSVWSLDDTNGNGGQVDDSLHVRSAIGFSVFWTTPIGPLRFNFSKVLVKESYDEEQNFDLTISTKF